MANTSLERRQGDALSQIVGTGDVRASLETLERNVRDIIDMGRERKFVVNIEGRDFYGFPLWHLLATVYGVNASVKEVQQMDGGWLAKAIAKAPTGMEWEAWGACTKKEPRKQNFTDHNLLAMAQTRAMRNALRAAFASALVLAGFDFADPDAPATNDQVAVLHILEREIGWDHDQGHVEAGDVASYKDLTREEASELIERWTVLRALRDEMSGTAAAGSEVDPAAGRSGQTASVPGSDVTGSAGISPTSPPGRSNTADRPRSPSDQSGEPSGSADEAGPSDQGTLEEAAKGYGEGPGSGSSGEPKLKRCTHPAWEPVKGRPGLLKCTTCGVGKKARPGH